MLFLLLLDGRWMELTLLRMFYVVLSIFSYLGHVLRSLPFIFASGARVSNFGVLHTCRNHPNCPFRLYFILFHSLPCFFSLFYSIPLYPFPLLFCQDPPLILSTSLIASNFMFLWMSFYLKKRALDLLYVDLYNKLLI